MVLTGCGRHTCSTSGTVTGHARCRGDVLTGKRYYCEEQEKGAACVWVVWVRDVVRGGSTVKFVGRSDKFVGSSDKFVGSSENLLEAATAV